jgi:class 3 adenylate cyclase/ribosomal protein S18 acetylase RimI-like enzyme
MTDTDDRTEKADLEEHHLRLRNLRLSDYEDVARIMDQVYSDIGGAWTRKQFAAQINRFPEGQICIEDNGQVIAAAISMIVNYDRFGDRHTYQDITSNGYLTNHDPNGDVLYGVDVFVDPSHRDMRLGRRLYDARKELCRSLNLRAIVAGGRIPGYRRHVDEMTPEEYIELVKRRELHDPILSFQLANDFHVRRVITGYMPEDDKSRAYATLVQWDNIFYETERTSLIGGRKSAVRIGTVQWQMRRVNDFDDLMTNVEFFVDAMAGYNCDFILFPEFFNAALLAQFNQDDPAEAMRGLAQYTDEICEAMLKLAVSYNINIVAGSMPVYEDNTLYNVAFLCRRDGTIDAQYKLHATPDERFYWGVQGGDKLRVFDTDVGRVGIRVCYDAEFPDLPRLLADQVMQILASYQAEMVPVVRKHGGSVDKFLGDGIMITFGASRMTETYAADALRCLEEVMETARRWEERLLAEGMPARPVNAAVATGCIVFGAVGERDRLEYTVIGEAVNLCAKVEKHNAVAATRALVAREAFELAREQGYAPHALWVGRDGVAVAGVGHTVDLLALA